MTYPSIATLNRLATGLASRRVTLLQVALFSAATAVFSATSLFDLHFGGVSTVGAERVLQGQIPYRDFWTMYAPGHFYLLAGVFYLFGTSLAIEAVAAAVLSAVSVVACYSLVRLMTGCSRLGLAGALVFGLAMYNTGYFKRLSTYPPAALLIFAALYALTLYLQNRSLSNLALSGAATGLLILFKHDVGIYTALAIATGMVVDGISSSDPSALFRRLGRNLGAYFLTAVCISIPVLFVFARLAGRRMLEQLVVFPLTDFRFARPETYPNLLPVGIFDPSPVMFLKNICLYLNFLFPFLVFVTGVLALGVALARNKPFYLAAGSTFVVGFLLHYSAAHVQINTHIVTLSAYAVFLGALSFTAIFGAGLGEWRSFRGIVVFLLVSAWSASLAAKPLYVLWEGTRTQTVSLAIPKVAGFRVTPEEAAVLSSLRAFVDSNTAPNEKIFVGLNRHDVVIVGDVLAYFILDRPIATRYQELHPAITDTAAVQATMIRELRDGRVRLIVLKKAFPGWQLEKAKADFQRHLPQVGALDLDHFIRQNYHPVREFGPYVVWMRRQKGS